jgi:hypothetical protein
LLSVSHLLEVAHTLTLTKDGGTICLENGKIVGEIQKNGRLYQLSSMKCNSASTEHPQHKTESENSSSSSMEQRNQSESASNSESSIIEHDSERSIIEHESFAGKPFSAHEALGHPGNQASKHFTVKQMRLPKNTICQTCVRGKHVASFKSRLQIVLKLLERLHSDTLGPLLQAFDNSKYLIAFMDEKSKFCWTFCVKTKSEFLEIFKKVHNRATAITGLKVINLRTDGAGEMNSLQMQTLCDELGINHEQVPPYLHSMNGIQNRHWPVRWQIRRRIQ